MIRTALALVFLTVAITIAAAQSAPATEGDRFAEDFILLPEPKPAPQAPFQTLSGKEIELKSFAGRAVLLNFWATWCAPCVVEMPLLESLHRELADEGLEVAAVSLDRGGAAVVAPFLADHGLRDLPVYLDPGRKLALAFGASALPATYLIDSEGMVIGYVPGIAEWDSPGAIAFLRRYLPEAGEEMPPVVKTELR